MDPLRSALALAPLGAYFLALALRYLSRRPSVVSGGRDLAALALGLSGLLLIGPVELLLPDEAQARFGAWVWPMLGALYVLIWLLVLLLQFPRLVIYNASQQQVRHWLTVAVRELDAQASFAGNSVLLPGLGIECRVEGGAGASNAALVCTAFPASLQGWQLFEQAIRAQAAAHAGRPHPFGWSLLFGGLLLMSTAFLRLAANPVRAHEAFAELFRL